MPSYTKMIMNLKKQKPFQKNFFDDELKHEIYKNLLFNRSHMRNEIYKIESKHYDEGLY